MTLLNGFLSSPWCFLVSPTLATFCFLLRFEWNRIPLLFTLHSSLICCFCFQPFSKVSDSSFLHCHDSNFFRFNMDPPPLFGYSFSYTLMWSLHSRNFLLLWHVLFSHHLLLPFLCIACFSICKKSPICGITYAVYCICCRGGTRSISLHFDVNGLMLFLFRFLFLLFFFSFLFF